ncbi:ModD protein [Methanospirillum hungatei]|jgi:molybdenum transport protein|nr:ModD protein [Methanospirillum hungatei]MBP9007977.1 ModD protein [Methanospirillum sp.]OQA58064.1 MAG: molybdenum transport protein ModD [Euryarchaeota archaeon ADurb.Bin294]HOW05111.1 ModD protein [Methanospirillum hungatei]
MIYFTEADIDRLIEDDLPAGDMTTFLLDLAGKKGSIALIARNEMIACCTEEAVRLYKKAGLEVGDFVASGTRLQPGDRLIEAKGEASAIHIIWRTGSAMIEFASGIAGRTNQLVMAAKKENPSISVAGTRKHPPFVKKMALKALMAGGGVPHRTGLSDTILIFREHLLFTGGYERLPEVIRSVKEKMKERKIVIEAHSLKEALIAAKSGADAVQMDKSTQEIFSECSGKCRAINPNICMIAAGAINDSNAGMYAKAGADVLVTSWMYFAPPADIMAEILPIDEY